MAQGQLPIETGKAPRVSPGPVYQGVCAQIRRLLAEGKENAGQEPIIDAALWAGTIAQARSLAASIDRVDGRNGNQANGVPLAQMHMQLDALMARLNPEATDSDPTGELVRLFQVEEAMQREESRRVRAQASHPEV